MVRVKEFLRGLRAQLDEADPGWREALRADLNENCPGWENFAITLRDEFGVELDVVILANAEGVTGPRGRVAGDN